MKRTIVMAAFLGICLWIVPVHAEEARGDFDGKKSAAVEAPGETARQFVRVPAPSGWDLKGKLLGSPFEGLCSITSNTEIAEYWQTPFGGAEITEIHHHCVSGFAGRRLGGIGDEA